MFTAAVAAQASAAKALIDYLKGPGAVAIIKAKRPPRITWRVRTISARPSRTALADGCDEFLSGAHGASPLCALYVRS